MPGVQTLLPLMLDHVANGMLSIERLIEMTSTSVRMYSGSLGKDELHWVTMLILPSLIVTVVSVLQKNGWPVAVVGHPSRVWSLEAASWAPLSAVMWRCGKNELSNTAG